MKSKLFFIITLSLITPPQLNAKDLTPNSAGSLFGFCIGTLTSIMYLMPQEEAVTNLKKQLAEQVNQGASELEILKLEKELAQLESKRNTARAATAAITLAAFFAARTLNKKKRAREMKELGVALASLPGGLTPHNKAEIIIENARLGVYSNDPFVTAQVAADTGLCSEEFNTCASQIMDLMTEDKTKTLNHARTTFLHTLISGTQTNLNEEQKRNVLEILHSASSQENPV